ncbi:hypothetical protein [Acinetobacter chinensis]|uniref:hypothetical protein n=1 Tax=Acinetobacter chinensis TaxID=2004650 RepID=UPI0029342014|nr:hypothetical protein [Acinetobacter chinensis]WOE40105.1 hypothetical protein QSG87_09280 [Acinetobacter chinensis]
MSYTTVLAVHPGEKVEELFELRNAWGSAPVIWEAMAQKYLGKGAFAAGDELWSLWKDKSIPVLLRTVHLFTFDRAYIVKKDFHRAAQDIREFFQVFPQPENHINHWFAIADYLETSPDVPAIGFHMTSVTENPFHDGWDEDTESYKPPDWSKCYSVYDEIQRSAEE